MTDADKLAERVATESGKSMEDIRKRMKERKEKTHGLLSDYGAIYAVAKECGIDLNESETVYTQIAKMKPSSSVNIVGRVKTVYSEREFSRKDGSKGKFASLIIADSSGEARVVLWDNNAQVTSKLRVGDTVSVKNGFVKENRGQVEIHAGALTNITINPTNVKADLPDVAERHDSINGLKAGMPSVNIVCRVADYRGKTEFKRPDGTTGSRATFTAEDESGSARVVLWNPLSEMELEDGDIIKIENAYTREGINGGVEIQAASRSRIVKTDAKLNLKTQEKKAQTLKVQDIKAGMSGFSVEARVLRVSEPREYSKGQLASLIIGDATNTMRVVLWDEKAGAAREIREGDAVRIRNAYSRINNNECEIHVGKYSQISVDSGITVPTAGEIGEKMTEEKRIVDLDVNDKFVKIRGKIVQVEDGPVVYMTCPECQKRVQNLGGEWMCDTCGVVEATPNMRVSIVVEDDSGNVRAVAFRDKAERILGTDTEEAMNLIGETQDEMAPIAQARERIIGSQAALTGRVNYNEYSDQLEFMVNDIV